MNTTKPNGAQVSRNVMEALVNQEIEQQLMYWSPQLAKYINKVEVMTYAMNRLPALYASSQKGWQHQMSRAKKEFGKQITAVVRQAFAAVQRDPLRTTVPLKPQEEVESLAALQKLKDLLQDEQLTWSHLVSAIEQSLVETVQGQNTWKSRLHTARSGYHWDDERYCM